jgi:calreticulin
MSRLLLLAVAVALVVVVAQAKVHFSEEFNSGWESRWTKSTAKEKDNAQGKWEWSAGEFYGDAEINKGIKTSEDNRFYGIAAQHPKFSNKGKDLVLQFEVKFPQKIDCGGGYLKFGPAPFPGEAFHGDTPYNIMFGPDFCGPSTKKTHVIFTYKGKNHLIKKSLAAKDDQLTHLYTLVVQPDNSYKVLIDHKEEASGKLPEDWDFLPAKEIKDPAKSKPSDWVDEAEIDDPTDKKPSSWDDTPRTVADPEAKKPEDWDDALDGEWEAPQIDNPEYKGDWKAKRIPNPAYKGAWVHPVVPNPEYKDDANIYAYDDFSWVGIDVWQVKSGTIFDNIIIADSLADADAFAAKTFDKTTKAEKEAFDKKEAANKAAEPSPDDDIGDKDEL